jgi:hypothetical protein
MTFDPERGYAAYLGGVMVLAFADGAGAIAAAGTDLPALARHPALHGRLLVSGIEVELVIMLKQARTCAELAEALRHGGLDVRLTPLSVLRRFLS